MPAPQSPCARMSRKSQPYQSYCVAGSSEDTVISEAFPSSSMPRGFAWIRAALLCWPLGDRDSTKKDQALLSAAGDLNIV